MRLLIVDDHSAIRSLIRECVGELAAEVRECASGEDAIAQCDAFTPDCVTVDLRMPGIDGLSTIARIRALHPLAYILLVTQFDRAGILERALRAGADGLVLKEHISSLATVLHWGVARASSR